MAKGIFGLFSKKKKSQEPQSEEKNSLVNEQDKELTRNELTQDNTTPDNQKDYENPDAKNLIETDEKQDEENFKALANDPDCHDDKNTDNSSNKVTSEVTSEEALQTVCNDKDNSAAAGKSDREGTAKLSFFERLKKTRENLSYGFSALIKGKQISEELYEDLETALLTADLGVETTNQVIEKLREESKLRELHDASALKENLKKILKNILSPCAVPLEIRKPENRPYVILMVGVNGAGKTTTIGKLTEKFKAQGLKVMLAAGDTFRAAAVEQLKAWGAKAGVPVVSQPTGSDSASVLYDALNSAKAHGSDVLICDTAGRLQNKDNLMEELKKIVRVIKKIDDNVPDEVLLVLDATTGQNAVSQVKLFGQAVNVTGLVLTKLDGTAKGGVVFALADQFKIPLRYIGIGEKAEDLRIFDIDAFVGALFE